MGLKLLDQQNHPPIQRHEVGCVILTPDHKVLLCQRSKTKRVAPGVWHLPGGQIDEGETDIETIPRELEEELGVKTVSIGEYMDVYFTYAWDDVVHQTRYYPVQVEGTITLNPESEAYAFVDLAEFETYLEAHTLDHHKKAAEKAKELSLISNIK